MRQPGHLVLGGVAGREEDHRDVVAVLPQAPAHLGALEVRQHHVEHHEVRPPSGGGRQGLLPGARHVDVEPLEAEGLESRSVM